MRRPPAAMPRPHTTLTGPTPRPNTTALRTARPGTDPKILKAATALPKTATLGLYVTMMPSVGAAYRGAVDHEAVSYTMPRSMTLDIATL